MRFRIFIETCFLIGSVSVLCLPADNAFISVAGDCRYPAVAAEGKCIFMTWLVAEGKTAGLYFRRSTDEGRAWDTARKISNENADCCPPAIAADSGVVHLIWIDYGETIDGEIYYARSGDGGVTWEKNYLLVKNANSARRPLLVCKGSNVFLIWQDVENKVFFKASRDRGQTWQGEIVLGKVGKHSCYCFPPAVSAQGNELAAVWTDFREDKRRINASLYGITVFKSNDKMVSSVVCRVSADNGCTWSRERILTSSRLSKEIKDEIDNPVMLSDGSLSYLFWLDRRNLQLGEIFYARFDLGTQKDTISGRVLFPSEKSSPKRPSAVFDAEKNLHVAWASFSMGESIVYYSEIDPAGNILKEKKNLASSPGRYHNPVIARTPSGLLYLFWFDEPKDKDQWSRIFLKMSKDNGQTWADWGS